MDLLMQNKVEDVHVMNGRWRTRKSNQVTPTYLISLSHFGLGICFHLKGNLGLTPKFTTWWTTCDLENGSSSCEDLDDESQNGERKKKRASWKVSWCLLSSTQSHQNNVRFQPWSCWGIMLRNRCWPTTFAAHLSQPEMPTDGVRSDECDQPLSAGGDLWAPIGQHP